MMDVIIELSPDEVKEIVDHMQEWHVLCQEKDVSRSDFFDCQDRFGSYHWLIERLASIVK